ncbi:hypothetical protein KC19_11G036100 [Ceratodon purpureus]|uniref:Methyltransferase domain-containing protein n=1 Tax=Ceratodon purpureus TaxID=3225 RepID=A0A8T0GGB6_CERPU|nr:hypothetical protein KC19_11G036100 [Ceratodon purpureus]
MAASMRPPPEIDSDEEESGDWEEWQAGGPEEAEEEEAAQCLFCSDELPSSKAVFQHCAEAHSFDFLKLRADAGLDFYDTLRLINFIRSKVAENKSWSAEASLELQESLREQAGLSVDTKQKGTASSSVPAWKDDKFLTPVLENDPLLYGFDDEGEDDDVEEMNAVDRNAALRELLEDKSNSAASTSTGLEVLAETGTRNDLADLTKVFLSLGDDIREELASPLDVPMTADVAAESSSNSSLQDDGAPDLIAVEVDEELSVKSSNGTEPELPKKKGKKDLKVTFAEVAKREARNVNKDYFGSYSAFGIHREMLSDKVRTDAYRDALVANPSLLKNAVVMDVGCGTGILSLFAAQAGASKVIAVDGSSKMAAVATEISKANGFLKDTSSPESSSKGVMTVLSGMIEELDETMPVEVHGVDVLVSEWMGYCLLFESMLPSVLHARDRWLKPGGAILPDTAEMFVAGFGKGGTSLSFWENVYGFNMKSVGEEVVRDATQAPIIDVVDSKDVITTSALIQAFDLATMKADDTDFTSQFKLELLPSSRDTSKESTNEATKLDVVWCYGLVVWFDTGFTERFCKDKPVLLSTSPHTPRTHWSQTILTFKEPIALCAHDASSEKMDKGKVGSEGCPASAITGRISIARSHRHRSIDISLETSAVSPSNAIRTWPVQMFDI